MQAENAHRSENGGGVVEDEQGFADDLVRLAHDSKFRSDLIDRGLQNALRYRPETMISKYTTLYKRVLTVCAESNVEAPLQDAQIQDARIQDAYVRHRLDQPAASAEIHS